MNQCEQKHLYDLITMSVDGNITPAQFLQLKQLLRSNPEAVRYYLDYMSILSDIRASIHLIEKSACVTESFDKGLWDELAAHENTAPEIVIQQEKPKKELIHKVQYPKIRRRKKLSKWEMGYLITSAAAVVFLVLFIRFAPPKGGIEVATLNDSMNARWADINAPMQKGMRFAAGSPDLLLREGFVELLFDNNTAITLEAPVEFRILAEDRIALTYGKAYARVPKEAIGFSVYTPNAMIVDMGTEFGVQADTSGDTQVHVLKGETMLVAGKQNNRTSMKVSQGAAKRISGATGEISDVGCQSEYFVRDINSQSNFAWRGQNTLDLADMIGGGNGTGTGNVNTGIRWEDGAFIPTRDYYIGERVQGTTDFIPVPNSLFVEGVFVPNSTNGSIQVARDEMVQWDVPETPGQYCYNIHNSGSISRGSGRIPGHTQILDGKLCGTPENPVISMHANAGVTFNLKEIRRYYTNFSLKSFTAVCGYSETFFEYPAKVDPGMIPQASFYVLVDGQPRFSKINMTPNDKACPIKVELMPDDTYLTLAVTGGDDQKVSYDWCLYGQPQINIE